MTKQNQNQNQKNGDKNNDDSKKKQQPETPPPTTVVLKVDMHCDGCASKIVRCLRGYQGVQTLKVESEVGNLTITGNVDPTKLRDKLALKMKKKVDLISPKPNKDKENKPQNNKPDDKNPKDKEPPVTTAVLKVQLHCQGCIERIRRTVLKTKGVYEMAIDKEKETVTVKGAIDVKAFVGTLSERLRRKVEVIPPKKEKEKEETPKEAAAANHGGNAGGKKKKGGGGGGGGGGAGGENDEDGGGDGKVKMEQSKMDFPAHAYGYGYSDGNYYGPQYIWAPQIFSDENPNACSLM